MVRILSVEDFEKIKNEGVGYVLITDKPNSTRRLHRADCPHVDYNNFYQKVIVNKEDNGGYYWFKDRLHALNELNAEECLVCKR